MATVWLIVIVVWVVVWYKKREVRSGQKAVFHNKCAYCGSRLKKTPGTSRLIYALTCARCGRVQPWSQ